MIDRFDPRFIEAAVVHDYLTDLGKWDEANAAFEDLLPDVWQKPIMVAGVKAYAKVVLRLEKV